MNKLSLFVAALMLSGLISTGHAEEIKNGKTTAGETTLQMESTDAPAKPAKKKRGKRSKKAKKEMVRENAQ